MEFGETCLAASLNVGSIAIQNCLRRCLRVSSPVSRRYVLDFSLISVVSAFGSVPRRTPPSIRRLPVSNPSSCLYSLLRILRAITALNAARLAAFAAATSDGCIHFFLSRFIVNEIATPSVSMLFANFRCAVSTCSMRKYLRQCSSIGNSVYRPENRPSD